MDFTESTRIVFNRIKRLEPENVTKIIGYLLLQDDGDQQMIHLALSPDVVIQEVIYKAKADLHHLQQLAHNSAASVPKIPLQFAPFSSQPFISPTSFRVSSQYWEPGNHNSVCFPLNHSDSIYELQSQTQFLSLEDQIEQANGGNTGFSNDHYYLDAGLSNPGGRTGRRYQNIGELPVKVCHYFNKGYCKHGSNCRYFHGQVSEGFHQIVGHNSVDSNEDQVFSSESFETLELEIIELLKSKRGNPVSIASLPMLYYEKYGKVLQADGYLTESQRHGKAGYSLTKLLARLKNTIRLIDRPHGQHAVILAEDASKYMDSRYERNDPGPIVCGSRQIYLTFPADSTFTEDDVANYFTTFGPVEDVRIPCQQKRMFGFVTFFGADTVNTILSKGNPHFVCGSRVLVKPYREKSKPGDRRYQERFEHPMFFSSHFVDMDPELHSIPRGCETSRLCRKQFSEDHEQVLALERRRLADLNFVRKPLANQSFFGYMDGSKVSKEHLNFPSAEHFTDLLDVLHGNDKINHIKTNYTDPDSSEGLNLPESPFASPVISSISAVI